MCMWTRRQRVKSSIPQLCLHWLWWHGSAVGVKGWRAVCFPVWTEECGRAASLKSAAVTQSRSRLTDARSALSTISTLCVLRKASTLDSHTLHDASYTLTQEPAGRGRESTTRGRGRGGRWRTAVVLRRWADRQIVHRFVDYHHLSHVDGETVHSRSVQWFCICCSWWSGASLPLAHVIKLYHFLSLDKSINEFIVAALVM